MGKRWARASVVFAILAHTAAASGQSPVTFEFGVRVGVPMMKNLRPSPTLFGNTFTTRTSEKPNYTVGPTLGAILYDRISVQFEALYKPVASGFTSSSPTLISSSSSRGYSWEFPILANYRFGRGPLRPYGGVGLVIGESVSTVTKNRLRNSILGIDIQTEGGNTYFFGQGPAYLVDAGIEWPLSYLIMRPEVRFSRWSHNQTNIAFRDVKQFEFLIGFSFRGIPSGSK